MSAGLAGDRQSDLRRGYENFVGTTVGVQGALRRDETNRATTLDPYVRAAWQKADWTLEGGLRRVNARYRSDDVFLSNGDQSGSTQFSGYLPVVGVRWQLTPQLQSYAAIGRGLETPTLNEAAYRPDGTAGFNTDLNASRSTSAEVGLRGRNAAGLWNATLFDIRTKDEIVSAGTSNGRATFTNGGTTRRQGLELSAEYGLGNVTLSSAYTYLRARYGSGTASIPAGNRLPGLPEQQLFAQLGWAPDWRGGHRRAVCAGGAAQQPGVCQRCEHRPGRCPHPAGSVRAVRANHRRLDLAPVCSHRQPDGPQARGFGHRQRRQQPLL